MAKFFTVLFCSFLFFILWLRLCICVSTLCGVCFCLFFFFFIHFIFSLIVMQLNFLPFCILWQAFISCCRFVFKCDKIALVQKAIFLFIHYRCRCKNKTYRQTIRCTCNFILRSLFFTITRRKIERDEKEENRRNGEAKNLLVLIVFHSSFFVPALR